jgi:hypothetical protein
MAKQPEEMTEIERRLFDMYCDLEWALAEEYEHNDAENVSKHLRDSVGKWSLWLRELGLLDQYYYSQAQLMAAGQDSWVNS